MAKLNGDHSQEAQSIVAVRELIRPSLVHVLAVDDERAACKLLAIMLRLPAFSCSTAASGEEALAVLQREHFDAVISDLQMPGISGLELLTQVRRTYPHVAFLVTTGVDDVEVGVQAMRSGADAYLVKPLLESAVIASRESALHKRFLEQQVENYRQHLEEMVADRTFQLSQALQQLERGYEDTLQALGAAIDLRDNDTAGHSQRVCRYSLEIACAIHELSPRREHAFVRLNCSAIPSGLLESELFGHERGAFTGAIAQKIGRLELAHRGTFFLDEVSDLPLELQPKILRALQEKGFERVGGTRTILVNVRLVAATNRDLAEMVSAAQFRSDLYYRLRVFPITIPPLRERRDDIPILARYFLSSHSKRMGRHIETIPPATMQALVKWPWPGDVRELENLIERSVILSPGPVLRAPLAELEAVAQPAKSTDSDLEAAEREHILRVLRECHGRIGGDKGAAVRLGLKRTTLNSMLKKFGIKRRDYI
jgi:DNA-binding NtrC family response regulator